MQEKEKHIQVWENCLRIIEQNIESQQYETWFKPIRPISLVDSTLTIEVPTDYYRSYLESAERVPRYPQPYPSQGAWRRGAPDV